MHGSVMEFLSRVVLPPEIAGKSVIEVGSQDVNGSPRTVVAPMRPASYIGVDFGTGAGIDVTLDVKNLVQYFGLDRFDVVISTEMLEHAQDWRTAVSQMKFVLKRGGLLFLTCRGPGFPYHGFPHDYWRFTVDDFKRIFSDMEILELIPDPGAHGVMLKAVKTASTGSFPLDSVDVLPVARG